MLRVRALDEGDAAAAGDVIHPDLTGSGGALSGEMLPGGDEAAVGAPGRVVEERERLLGDLPLARAVRVHDPDIVAASSIRSEGDLPTVRREARLHLERQAARDPGRPAAGDRHGIDVAEQIEGDRPPVGADIDVHPCPFGRVDRDRAGLQCRRRGHVPLLLVVLRLSERGRGHEDERKRGNAFDHEGAPKGRTGARQRVGQCCLIRPARGMQAASLSQAPRQHRLTCFNRGHFPGT